MAIILEGSRELLVDLIVDPGACLPLDLDAGSSPSPRGPILKQAGSRPATAARAQLLSLGSGSTMRSLA